MALFYPAEGRNYFMDVAVHDRAKISEWYIIMFEGNYDPQEDDTAANIVARATEIVAYNESTRPAFIESAAVGGSTNNSASLAQFTLTAAKAVHGFAVISSGGKGTTTGVLLAIEKLATPRSYSSGDVIKVPVTLSLTNPA